jgi:hypothetical protein
LWLRVVPRALLSVVVVWGCRWMVSLVCVCLLGS